MLMLTISAKPARIEIVQDRKADTRPAKTTFWLWMVTL